MMTIESEAEARDRANDEARRRKQMLDRIHAAMESKMLEIESRLARDRETAIEPASAADSERDVRTLNTLTRMIEKISVLMGTTGAAEGEEKTDPEAEARDADRLRDEIAERIARLRECGTI